MEYDGVIDFYYKLKPIIYILWAFNPFLNKAEVFWQWTTKNKRNRRLAKSISQDATMVLHCCAVINSWFCNII